MNGLARANFDDLIRIYRTPNVESAQHLVLVASGPPGMLHWILQHHRNRMIVDPREIRIRADVDQLLGFYGVLECALMCDFIEAPASEPFWLQISQTLRDPAVSDYYVKHYPLKLPQLLLYRLDPTVHHAARERASSRTTKLFLEFLALDQRFRRNHGDGVLLDLLDDFWIAGRSFNDMSSVLSQPARYLEYLLADAAASDVLVRATKEFHLFIQFCLDFADLLAGASSFPLLRSAMWHHYGYWFEILSDELGKKLDDSLACFQQWNVDARGEGQDSAHRALQAASSTIRTLFSAKYAYPVELELLRAKARATGAQEDGSFGADRGAVVRRKAASKKRSSKKLANSRKKPIKRLGAARASAPKRKNTDASVKRKARRKLVARKK